MSPLFDGQLVIDGLLVAGTEPRCGKTVVTTGLVAAMKDKGFLVQAIKPLSVGEDADTSLRVSDQSYMNLVTRPLSPVDCLSINSPYDMTSAIWQKVQHLAKKPEVPCVIESPGSVTDAIGWVQGKRYDTTHFASALGIPMVLVCTKQPDFLSRLIPIVQYIRLQQGNILGWITTEPRPMAEAHLPQWEAEALWFQQEFQLPLLGELAFSPSINVQAGNQGNLIRQTLDGIDLFPLEQALNLLLPLGASPQADLPFNQSFNQQADDKPITNAGYLSSSTDRFKGRGF